VSHICKMLDLEAPAALKASNVTDKKRYASSLFRRVEPVQRTPRLAAALNELTLYDEQLYRCAVREFERRSALWESPGQRFPAAGLESAAG